MSKETTPDLASLAAKYLGMTDEQLANIPYPQLFDIIRQLAGSVLTQFEDEEPISGSLAELIGNVTPIDTPLYRHLSNQKLCDRVEAPDPSRVSMETDNDHQPKDGD
jgi:hypothetical protein